MYSFQKWLSCGGIFSTNLLRFSYVFFALFLLFGCEKEKSLPETTLIPIPQSAAQKDKKLIAKEDKISHAPVTPKPLAKNKEKEPLSKTENPPRYRPLSAEKVQKKAQDSSPEKASERPKKALNAAIKHEPPKPSLPPAQSEETAASPRISSKAPKEAHEYVFVKSPRQASDALNKDTEANAIEEEKRYIENTELDNAFLITLKTINFDTINNKNTRNTIARLKNIVKKHKSFFTLFKTDKNKEVFNLLAHLNTTRPDKAGFLKAFIGQNPTPEKFEIIKIILSQLENEEKAIFLNKRDASDASALMMLLAKDYPSSSMQKDIINLLIENGAVDNETSLKDSIIFIENNPDQRHLFKYLLEALLIEIERSFGPGVVLPSTVKESYIHLFKKNSDDYKFKIFYLTLNCLNARFLPEDERAHPFIALKTEIALMPHPIDPKQIETLSKAFSYMQEQSLPMSFNTQYFFEYLPKYFMTEDEKKLDPKLPREEPALLFFSNYEAHLRSDDPRKLAIVRLKNKAKKFGFKEDEEFHIGSGIVPELCVGRLYGMQRTKDSFRSIVGLIQGTRYQIGVDEMPWPYKTNSAKKAAIMKLLRAIETSEIETRQKENFENEYNKVKDILNFDDNKKKELKTELLQFAKKRIKRLNKQVNLLFGF